MALTLWHNPRCSKSRAAKAILDDAGVDFVLRLYLKDPPTADEVAALAARVGRPLADLLRTGEAAYKDKALKGAGADTLASAVADAPILLERPILDDGTRAIVGRPPEAIKDLL